MEYPRNIRAISHNEIEAYNCFNDSKKQASVTSISSTYNVDRKFLAKMIKLGIVNIKGVWFLNNAFLMKVTTAYDEYCHLRDNSKEKITMAHFREKYGIHPKFFSTCMRTVFNDEFTSRGIVSNEDVFETIDSAEKAYWLGFILADGYIRLSKGGARNKSPSKVFGLKLGDIDKSHVYKLADFIGVDDSKISIQIHPGTRNKLYSIWVVCSKLYDDLSSKGVNPNKTLREEMYLDIDVKFIRHYLRGIFDGDGHIKKNGKAIGLCGSKHVVSNFNWLVSELLEIPNAKIWYDEYESGQLYRTAWYSKSSKEKILEFLYGDTTDDMRLSRKFDLAKQICPSLE